MTKEELKGRIADLEWEDFEVKTAKSELPKEIWESVSSFSNCYGGWIVLGVKQEGKKFSIQGVDNIEKLEQDFFGTLRSQKFNAQLIAQPKRCIIDDKKILHSIYLHQKSNPSISMYLQIRLYEWVVVTSEQRRRRLTLCSETNHLE